MTLHLFDVVHMVLSPYNEVNSTVSDLYRCVSRMYTRITRLMSSGGGKNCRSNYISKLNIKLLCCFISIFLVFFLIEFNTPMHSDDYSYGLMGFDLTKHFRHYVGWSGRVVADFVSPIILTFHFSQLVVALIISFISTSLIYLIVAIGSALFDSKVTSSKLLILTSIYWVSNPNLGQINFWVVGASNYLVTTTFVAWLLYSLLKHKSDNRIRHLPYIFLLSLISGCTNENVCLTLIYVLVSIVCYYKWKKIKFNKGVFVIAFCGVVAGALILLLSPGNYARLHCGAFDDWVKLTLFQKIENHLNRMLDYFVFLKFALIFYVIQLLILVINKSYSLLLASLFFFSSSIVAILVMVAAPGISIVPRAYSGIFFFLLLAVAVGLDVNIKANIVKFCFLGTVLFFQVLFIISFIFMYVSYKSAYIQGNIRNLEITYEKTLYGNSAEVEIPQYYFIKLLKGTDAFDLFHSVAQSDWFSVKKTSLVPVIYDYSIIQTGRELPFINKSKINITKVFYKHHFPTKQSTIMIESSEPLPKQLHVQYYKERKDSPSDLYLFCPIKLLDKYYMGISGQFKNVEVLLIDK